jgi:F-box and leucine-rich repeat protein GRR1
MLHLTSCIRITNDTIEGIVSNCLKIHNLVVAKCSLLTDAAVESICKLGKHLHYLHLGHIASFRITRTSLGLNALLYSDLLLRNPVTVECALMRDTHCPHMALRNNDKDAATRHLSFIWMPNLDDQLPLL